MKAKVSWYNSDEDFEDNIMTSVICGKEETEDVLDAITMEEKQIRKGGEDVKNNNN